MQMNNLFKIAFIAAVIASCSCHEVFISEKDLQNDIFYYNNEFQPFSGVCVTTYQEIKQVKTKRTYKDGIMNGLTRMFYANGQLNKQGNYKNGKFHGKWEGWYEDGTKSFEINHAEGLLDGAYITYYKNGNMKEKGVYKDNNKYGHWQYFDKGGNLVDQKTY